MKKDFTFEIENEKIDSNRITYNSLFWIFLFGCVLGVIIEGVFCLVTKGVWESHVVSVWGWFNTLYGAGAALLYAGSIKLNKKRLPIRVAILTVVATVLEFICGLYLQNILGMKAWDYSNEFLNISGLICLKFTFFWALIALVMCLVSGSIRNHINFFEKKQFRVSCGVMTVLLLLNFIMTFMAINRWSDRYYGFANDSRIGVVLDTIMPDEWMQHRFIEWRFLA